MLCGSLDRKGVWGRMDTCKCMAESLSYSSETITTLLISYTPIQNKKKKGKKRKTQFRRSGCTSCWFILYSKSHKQCLLILDLLSQLMTFITRLSSAAICSISFWIRRCYLLIHNRTTLLGAEIGLSYTNILI